MLNLSAAEFVRFLSLQTEVRWVIDGACSIQSEAQFANAISFNCAQATSSTLCAGIWANSHTAICRINVAWTHQYAGDLLQR